MFATFLDKTIFNLVLSTKVFSDLDHISFIAKSVFTVIAVCVAYRGHRFWTFKHRIGSSSTRNQVGLFVLVNVIGLLIALTCLWVSRYIFGCTSQLSDNISANFVGFGLAAAFRFFASGKFVFKA